MRIEIEILKLILMFFAFAYLDGIFEVVYERKSKASVLTFIILGIYIAFKCLSLFNAF
jgi:hypothetical protein